jgi:hypothetical protein
MAPCNSCEVGCIAIVTGPVTLSYNLQSNFSTQPITLTAQMELAILGYSALIPNNYATYLSKNTIKMLLPLFSTFIRQYSKRTTNFLSESRIILNAIFLQDERISLVP